MISIHLGVGKQYIVGVLTNPHFTCLDVWFQIYNIVSLGLFERQTR